MKYEFSQIYEFPSSVPTAVVTFLDCEHYAHLHSDIETRFEIIDINENKCRQKIDYKWSFLEWSQITTVEYTPPATLTQYDSVIKGKGVSALANLLKVKTTLRYYLDDNDKTISDLKYEINMPFWMYPFRGWIRKRLEKMKLEKDNQDIEMIQHREKLFGKDHVKGYLAPHQLILFKELFIKTFFKDTIDPDQLKSDKFFYFYYNQDTKKE